jgi:hypothetical protein
LVGEPRKIRPRAEGILCSSKNLFTAAPHKPPSQPYSRNNANPDGIGDALSLGFNRPWYPEGSRPTGGDCQTPNTKKLLSPAKLACPLQKKFTTTRKEEESETARRLKNGIIAKKAFFSTR